MNNYEYDRRIASSRKLYSESVNTPYDTWF